MTKNCDPLSGKKFFDATNSQKYRGVPYEISQYYQTKNLKKNHDTPVTHSFSILELSETPKGHPHHFFGDNKLSESFCDIPSFGHQKF